LLLATELAVFARAVGEGWWKEKLRAWAAVVGSVGAINQRRRIVQEKRKVTDSPWLELTTAEFETPLAQSGAAAALEPVVASYRRILVRASR
jgi:hypothetical protein